MPHFSFNTLSQSIRWILLLIFCYSTSYSTNRILCNIIFVPLWGFNIQYDLCFWWNSQNSNFLTVSGRISLWSPFLYLHFDTFRHELWNICIRCFYWHPENRQRIVISKMLHGNSKVFFIASRIRISFYHSADDSIRFYSSKRSIEKLPSWMQSAVI